MKKILYTLSLALLTALVADLKAQSVSYTYVKNNPFDTKNFSAAIDPLFIDMNGHNGYAFGWGVRGEYMMGKTLLLNVDSRFGFGTQDYRKSNVNTRNYFNMEGGLGLIFYQKTRTRNVPIILSQTTSGNTRTTVSIRGGVPAKCRLIVALRGGVQQYNNTLNYKNLADSLLTFNGETYKQAKVDTKSTVFNDTVHKLTNVTDPLGAFSSTSIYGGFQFRTIRDLVIDVDGYGYRGNIRYSDFFIDIMFAPVVKIRDFKNADGTTYNVKYDGMSHLGWRLGWFWRKPKDQGFSAKFEFGSRPGFKAPTNTNIPVNIKNLYAMLTFGLYIPLKIHPFYGGEE